jgi:hypothetical protein
VFGFHLSPHWFKAVVKRGCEVVIHGIWTILDVHFDWVVFQVDIVNAFNTILRKYLVIF